MQIGRKIYYEKLTGESILIIPEKFNGIQTTKEQDFSMYEILSIRNPESVGLIELEYGQYNSDFQTANYVMVDLETGELIFNYPEFVKPLSILVDELKAENELLKEKNLVLEQSILELSMLLGGM